MPLAPGIRLGRYQILSQLGAGGMGEVYRARDTQLDRVVAVKVLPPSMSRDPEALERFGREAKAVAALSHPNILAIFDFATVDGIAYAAMELLEGESLRARLEGGPLLPRRAVEYALQVCQGLGAAHDKGIVHRDLKPENLFITRDNRVKILDFGLAKVRPSQAGAGETMDMTPPTEPGTVMGTVGYMSPEQVRGEEVDQRSDLFSFGSILYEMLTGRRAFKADSAVETMSAILKQDPPELDPASAHANPALERVVRHCLEKQREARFQSARDLAFQLETLSGSSAAPSTEEIGSGRMLAQAARRRPTLLIALGVLAGLAAPMALGFAAGVWRNRTVTPTYQQLTFQRGTISTARFAPDGSTILYSAAWNGGPMDVLSTRPESAESRSLDLSSSGLLSVSSTGELALAAGCQFLSGACRGTLARVPLAGGAPREVLADVNEADWTPDGRELAVVRSDQGRQGRYRLEFPPGKVLHEAAGTGWISHLRFSPKGDLIAYLEHPSRGDDSGTLAVIGTDGKERFVTETWGSIWGLAWAPSGDEVWFTAATAGRIQPLRAVTLSGKQRILLQAPARFVLQDVSRTGEVLLTRESARSGMMCLAPGQVKETELTWFDWSSSAHLSADGHKILFAERGEGTRGAPTVYVRGTDGSAAVKLGEGRPLGLSPDGAWATVLSGDRGKLTLLPMGAGLPQEVPAGKITRFVRAAWFPQSKRLLVLGTEGDRTRRCYIVDPFGTAAPQAAGPQGPGVDFVGDPISPDEKLLAAAGPDGTVALFPLDGSGEPRALPELPAGALPIQWAADGKHLFVSQRESFPARVLRVDVGRRTFELWKELIPSDATGIVRLPSIEMTADGKSYVYTFNHRLSELYLAQGLR